MAAVYGRWCRSQDRTAEACVGMAQEFRVTFVTSSGWILNVQLWSLDRWNDPQAIGFLRYTKNRYCTSFPPLFPCVIHLPVLLLYVLGSCLWKRCSVRYTAAVVRVLQQHIVAVVMTVAERNKHVVGKNRVVVDMDLQLTGTGITLYALTWIVYPTLLVVYEPFFTDCPGAVHTYICAVCSIIFPLFRCFRVLHGVLVVDRMTKNSPSRWRYSLQPHSHNQWCHLMSHAAACINNSPGPFFCVFSLKSKVCVSAFVGRRLFASLITIPSSYYWLTWRPCEPFGRRHYQLRLPRGKIVKKLKGSWKVNVATAGSQKPE